MVLSQIDDVDMVLFHEKSKSILLKTLQQGIASV